MRRIGASQRLVIPIVLGCVAGGLAWWRLSDRGGLPTKASMIAEARKELRKLRELRSLATREEAFAALDGWKVVPGQNISHVQLEKLRDALAEFLFWRFGSLGPKEYREWRAASGYEFRSGAELALEWGLPERYRELVGGSLSDVDWAHFDKGEASRLFDAMFEAGEARGSGCNRVAGVYTDDGAQITSLTVWTPMDQRWQTIEAGLGQRVWFGPRLANMRCWYEWKPGQKALLARDKRVLCALTGLVLAFEDGSRRPILLSHLWDRKAQRWILTTFSQRTVLPECAVPLEY